MGFKKVMRILILIFAYFSLGIGVIFGLIVLTGGFAAISITLDMILPQFASIAFVNLIVMLLIVRLKWGQQKSLIIALVLGFLAFSLNILPFLGVNGAVRSADAQFDAVFGTNWQNRIPSELQAKFREVPFNLWDVYNGLPTAQCNVSYDIEYAFVNGNDSLRFDVYSPSAGNGPFPAIIAIHGGGWTSGNKGQGNLFQMNRYLASQGYVVFDIIYGLAESSLSNLLKSQKILGRSYVNYNNSYTIPQMIENIGNFTHYLAAHANDYKVNLTSVYVLGRSAGAHLAACVGLGYNNSPYSSVFNHSIRIRGCILYYPPVNMTTMLENSIKISRPYTKWVNITELFEYLMEYNATNYDIYSPISYVDANSPPVLILHGKNDKLVPTSESRNLKAKMDAVGRPCILIEMPFMGHAFDIIPGNLYGQLAYYYVERFIAITSAVVV